MRTATLFVLYLIATLLVVGLVLVGWLMKKLYRGEFPGEDMSEGMCWTFAIPKWLVDPRHSYLVIRLSKSNFWPHVFYAASIDGLAVEEFAPLKRLHGWKSIFAAVWFKGKVRKGKGET